MLVGGQCGDEKGAVGHVIEEVAGLDCIGPFQPW